MNKEEIQEKYKIGDLYLNLYRNYASGPAPGAFGKVIGYNLDPPGLGYVRIHTLKNKFAFKEQETFIESYDWSYSIAFMETEPIAPHKVYTLLV